MKKQLIGLLAGLALVLSACNSGTTSPDGTANQSYHQISLPESSKYSLANYKLEATQTGNCSLTDDKTIDCDSKGTFGGLYKISFDIPDNADGAYVIMPPEGKTYGLNIAATGEGCEQSPAAPGTHYACNFTIAANGTAQKGHSIHLQLNGNPGKEKFVKINLN